MAWRSERVSRRCAAFVLLTSAAAAPASAQSLGELRNMSIDQLAQIEVRSASKREEPLSSAPAALYVITPDDILTSGATTLPEVLRLAPNLNVQQVDASQYSISARGFNGVQAGNKVLALIDGRTIYTPLGSSVLWNLHFPMVEDLQQIEVISGPGGTLYGPNAVNGVINITSKDARDTIGTLVRGTAGADEITAAARQGFALGKSGALRVYADYHNADGLPAGLGAVDDSYKGWQAGFRSDFDGEADHFTLQGDLFHTDANTLPGDGANGHNVLGRWTRTLSPTSSFQVQAYYDYFKREFTDVLDSLQTMDAEGQFNTVVGRHDLVAGVGVRTTRDHFVNDLNIFNLNPESRRLWTSNIFAQDRFHLSDDLALIAGVKVERSTFTGWQVLPNLRLAWQPNQRNLVWAAVSRAVRTPSRIDRQLEAPPFLVASPDHRSPAGALPHGRELRRRSRLLHRVSLPGRVGPLAPPVRVVRGHPQRHPQPARSTHRSRRRVRETRPRGARGGQRAHLHELRRLRVAHLREPLARPAARRDRHAGEVRRSARRSQLGKLAGSSA
jgi:iron complex outermembrane receptor protein